MTTPFTERVRFTRYRPARTSSGPSDGSIYRGENMLPRGNQDQYWENMRSPRDRSETATVTTLTGTVATTLITYTVTGTGTLFLTELQVGDFIIVARQLVRVRRIDSDTSLQGSVLWVVSQSGLTATHPRRIRAIQDRRYTMLRGNLIKTASGHLVGVGSGSVLRDGAALPGGGFTLSKTPRIAIFDGTNYTQYNLSGMTVALASAFTLAAVAGGTKNMAAQAYTVRIAPARFASTTDGTKISLGYGNPCDPISVTLAANQRVQITFPAMDTGDGQNAWRIYVSLSTEVIQGPWFFHSTITSADLGGTGAGTTFNIEWLDGEVDVNEIISFNNDPAPDAGFITNSLDGRPTLYSCNGEGGTTPGPFIRPGKPGNLEGYPIDWRLALPEDIIGVVAGDQRDYAMTARGLYIVESSGVPASPVTYRPFWNTGFYHSEALVLVQDQLYGWTRSGPRRSIQLAAEGSERFDFAEDIQPIIAFWNYENVIVAHDPKNEAVLFFHTPQPASGDVYTECLAFMLRTQQWSTLLKLRVSGSDFIVSSAVGGVGSATVSAAAAGPSTCNMVANGSTYEHDTGGETVDWYLASHYINLGSDALMKSLNGFTVTAQTRSGTVGIFGYGSDENEPLLSGDNLNPSSLVGAIALDDADVTTIGRRSQYEEIGLTELAGFAFRIEGEYDGVSSKRNSVDEFTLHGHVHDIKSW